VGLLRRLRHRMFTDRVFRMARVWSNDELRRVAPMCRGAVVNVSGWRDQDKEGGAYRRYFSNCTEYHISNFNTEVSGYQGDLDNEFFLDLEQPLPDEQRGRYDTVFNHTTLEHVFEVRLAVANLCAMSRDAVILVTPFLQQQHEAFGDFWRFTPLALRRLLVAEGFEPVYMSWNDTPGCSVYVFTVASRRPGDWAALGGDPGNMLGRVDSEFIGTRAVRNHRLQRFAAWLKRLRKG